MKKKSVLFVINHLTIGGAQKALISALDVIDYSKYDVTLYLRKNRTDLLYLVPKEVEVIINEDKTGYYRKPYAVLLQLGIMLCSLFGRKKDNLQEKQNLYVKKKSSEYEKNKYFSGRSFDTAIAYSQGNIAEFVAEKITADEKYVFFHSSTDSLHSLHEKILGDFQRIVAEHTEQAELIGSWYPEYREKLRIIENYVDIDLVRAQSREREISAPDNKIVLCYCGRFTPDKGFDLAVETARCLKNKGEAFVWYFVGDGVEREKLEALVREYELTENIIFTGMQKNPYVYMATCDIYVQASYEENTGITMLEAMRLCKPVVTTRTTGGERLVKNGENGFVCDINPQALANGIEKLMSDKALRESIVRRLSSADYSAEKDFHRKQWTEFLG